MATPPPSKYNPEFAAQFDKDQALDYVIRKLLRGMHTADLVQVLAVTTGTTAVGFLTVQPVVLDQDTNGYVLTQTPIYNVPFMRYQSGASAIFMDPDKGDVGLCLFTERDTSGAKARAIAGQPLPGAAPTDRTHSSADAFYIGGVLNGAATQWIKFKPNGAGIDITSPGAITMEAPSSNITLTAQAVVINAPTQINSTLTTTGNITAPDILLGPSQFSILNHVHTGGTLAGGLTGPLQG